MNFMWVYVLVIFCGLRGVVAPHPDGYIGCYSLVSIDQNMTFSDNSGRICKNYCFPQYRYAGTSRLNGQPKTVCAAGCPSRSFVSETCGGIHRMTVYDAQKIITTTSTTSSTLKTSTTSGVISIVNSTSVKTNSSDGDLLPSFLKIIILVCILILLVTIAVCAVLLARRIRRKRLKWSRKRVGPQACVNNTHVGHCGDGGINSRQDDQETEYDTTTWRPNLPPSSAEDDYGRMKLPGGRFEDPTYSNMRNNQLGACAVLEGEYSYLGRTERGNTCTYNEKSDTVANDYDSVQFNKQTKVLLVRRSGLSGVSNEDVYDKLQNKF